MGIRVDGRECVQILLSLRGFGYIVLLHTSTGTRSFKGVDYERMIPVLENVYGRPCIDENMSEKKCDQCPVLLEHAFDKDNA